MRKYYTLAIREDGRWSPQFGDYDRANVCQERDDGYRDQHKQADMKIITTGDSQAEINKAIEELNA